MYAASDADCQPYITCASYQCSKCCCRFYIMRLPSRGLAFDRITYHASVTQCLGSLGEQPWYMAVAKPTGSLEAWPRLDDLQAFRCISIVP